MHTNITVGKPIVLDRLRHTADCDIRGFEGKKGDFIVLSAPRTEEEAETLRRAGQAGHRAGQEMRELLGVH